MRSRSKPMSGATKATRYRSRGEIQRVKLPQILEHYDAPVLFLWGEHDVTATPGEARISLTHGHPERAFKLLADGGHWIQFELAEIVNSELEQWFGGVRS